MWYTRVMNDAIRQVLKQALETKGMSQGELARVLDVPRPNITRALSGRSGEIPTLWVRMLETLELELIAVPRASQVKGGGGNTEH